MNPKIVAQLSTVDLMVSRLSDDIHDECIPCFEHHIEVISSILYGILYELQGEDDLGEEETVR